MKTTAKDLLELLNQELKDAGLEYSPTGAATASIYHRNQHGVLYSIINNGSSIKFRALNKQNTQAYDFRFDYKQGMEQEMTWERLNEILSAYYRAYWKYIENKHGKNDKNDLQELEEL